MKSRKILYLVDDMNYILNDCYQSGLYKEMSNQFDLKVFQFNPKIFLSIKKYNINLKKYDKIISALRLRTLYKYWPFISEWMAGKELIIYDQDPWESYIDDSPYKGVYQTLNNNLNIDCAYVTAPFWANKLNSDGIKADFVEMGIPQERCSEGLAIDERIIDIGFVGSMHPRRKKSFDKLKKMGVEVDVYPSRLSHKDYLKYIQTMKIFLYDESQGNWICDGKKIKPSTGMWIKALEIASRGTFCIRDYHKEGMAYNISNIPLIQCFKTLDEVPNIVEKILVMSAKEKKEIQEQSVNYIKRRNAWHIFSKKLRV